MKAKILLMLTASVLLTACLGINRKTCYFVDGDFSTVNESDNYFLEVRHISKEEFDEAKNVNVVKDLVLKENQYFSLKFYTYNVEGDVVQIDLVNIVDSNPKTKDVPITYVDDNGIRITPLQPKQEKYYCVTYQSQDYYFDKMAEE